MYVCMYVVCMYEREHTHTHSSATKTHRPVLTRQHRTVLQHVCVDVCVYWITAQAARSWQSNHRETCESVAQKPSFARSVQQSQRQIVLCLSLARAVYVCKLTKHQLGLCMHVCVCMYVRMYVCMYVCMFLCKYVFMYVCMYVCMQV